jgi:tRNA(Ile)-lysidine synthetase-like protein
MTRPSAIVRTALRRAAARLPELFDPRARLVVGFSGGQDSTCLLHALAGARRRPELVAVHVDHGLRPRSAAEGERIAALARALGACAVVRRVDVPAFRAERSRRRWTVQQAARTARYQALAAVAADVGADALVVAHTADDQAETVLLHLLRGAGLAGLSAMRLDERLDPVALGPLVPELRQRADPPPPLRVVRPLLRVPRATTLAYCRELRLEIAEDASNRTRAYTRNRVRLDLLPVLERFNPAIRTVLARAADLAADDEAALSELAGRCFAELVRGDAERGFAFDRRGWLALPRAVQRRLLRHALRLLTGGLEDVRDSPIEDALDVVVKDVGQRHYDLPRGGVLETTPSELHIRRRARDELVDVGKTRPWHGPCV